MSSTSSTPSSGLLARATHALGGILTFLARNNPRYQILRGFQMMTDAQYAARGQTRASAVRHAFRHRSYL